MTSSPARRRLRRWTLALVALAVTLVGLIVARQRAVATRWAEAVASAGALQARLEHRSPARLRQRPVEPTTPTDAWADYAAAITALETEPADEAAALTALRRASDAATARFPVPWLQGFGGDLPGVAGLVRLNEISAAQVEAATRDRNQDLALARLGDGLQLAVDLLGAGVAIYEVLGATVLDTHRAAAIALAQTLDPTSQAAARLAALLTATDSAISLRSESVRLEGALVVRSMADLHGLLSGSFAWGLWRYAFSAEIATAAHVKDTMAMADEIDALLADGTTTGPALRALQDRHHKSRNPITRLCAQNLVNTVGERLAALARLRMLRIALDECLGAPPLTLPNPLGGAFRTERTAAVVRVLAPTGESLELGSALGR